MSRPNRRCRRHGSTRTSSRASDGRGDALQQRTNIQRFLFAISVLAAMAGAVLMAWSIREAAATPMSQMRLVLLGVLTCAAAICSRFPLRLGARDMLVTLDSIPLALAVLLLPTHDSVLVGVAATIVLLIGQPMQEPGWRGWFWRVQNPLVAGLVMGAASELAHLVVGPSTLVLLVPAFIVAVALEAMFNTFVLAELEATSPGSGRHLLDVRVVLAANVLLPTAAASMLTPYVDARPWEFALLLPVLLLGMYGALWVANSQQLEKRRGDRLKDTFGRYVPEGIVDDNIESMQEIELGGQQHDVSVLFCDIRGFTSWSEDKGASEVITELNVLLTELSLSVMSTGGTLDKFTGDGLMAFWGAPVPVEDHADRASRAALDMLQRLDAVNARREAEGHSPFAIGVAVHSGTAVVGNVGHERRLDYTAIGDTVNTTARLEASTKDLGAVLLVSRATVDQLGEELRDRAMLIGDVVMKGKARAVEAWALQPLRPEVEDMDDEFAA